MLAHLSIVHKMTLLRCWHLEISFRTVHLHRSLSLYWHISPYTIWSVVLIFDDVVAYLWHSFTFLLDSGIWWDRCQIDSFGGHFLLCVWSWCRHLSLIDLSIWGHKFVCLIWFAWTCHCHGAIGRYEFIFCSSHLRLHALHLFPQFQIYYIWQSKFLFGI